MNKDKKLKQIKKYVKKHIFFQEKREDFFISIGEPEWERSSILRMNELQTVSEKYGLIISYSNPYIFFYLIEGPLAESILKYIKN